MYSSFEGAASVRRDWTELVARIPLGGASYDPRCPERWQRNVPVTFADLKKYTPDPSATPVLQMAARHGFSIVDQMRVLICDGPSLLAWVGATRERPFDAQEVRLMRIVTRPLRPRLTLERRLGIASIAWPAMEAALDATPAAAVLVRAPCSVQHCNAAAATLLAQDRVAFLDGLREAIAGRGDGTWLTMRLDVDGPKHFLAMRRLPPADPAPRAAAAGEAHGALPSPDANPRTGCSGTAKRDHRRRVSLQRDRGRDARDRAPSSVPGSKPGRDGGAGSGPKAAEASAGSFGLSQLARDRRQSYRGGTHIPAFRGRTCHDEHKGVRPGGRRDRITASCGPSERAWTNAHQVLVPAAL